MNEEGVRKVNRDPMPQWGRRLRRWLGAGAYPALGRWLDPSRQYSQLAYAPLLDKLVPNGGVWLDAGCGHQVFKLNSASEESEIIRRIRLAVGCDLTLQALRNHRTLRLRVCGDLDCLPFADAVFDTVSLNYVAEHLREPERTFKELARLLRPEGTLVLVTPNANGYFVRLTRVGRRFLPESLVRKFILIREFRTAEDIFPTFYRANTKGDLARLAEEAGLIEVDFRMINDPAIFSFIAPLAAMELLLGRLLSLLRLDDLKAGTIIGVYRRAGGQLARPGKEGNEMVATDSFLSSYEATR